MKINKKFLFINIIILIITYFVCEYVSFVYELWRAYPYFVDKNKVPFSKLVMSKNHYFLKNICVDFDKLYQNTEFRPIEGSQYTNKKPIVIFGCSFAYGAGLFDNQTFSHKLSEYTKRKVYNRAYNGWGPQNMLYQVKRKDFYDIVKEEPEMIIYVFMSGHTMRAFTEIWAFENEIFYKDTKDSLKESYFRSGRLLYGYTARQIRRLITTKKDCTQAAADFAIKHFTESKKEMEKHWKNTKYCIFVYSYNDNKNFEKKYLETLRNKDFIVIFADDITDKNIHSTEYRRSNFDEHPNEKAWDLLVPLFSKAAHL